MTATFKAARFLAFGHVRARRPPRPSHSSWRKSGNEHVVCLVRRRPEARSLGWEVVPSGRGFLDTRPYRFPSVLPPRLQWLTPSIVQPTRSLRSLLPLFLFLPIQLPPASSLPHSRTARTYFNVVSLVYFYLAGGATDGSGGGGGRGGIGGEVGETAAAVADHNSPSLRPPPIPSPLASSLSHATSHSHRPRLHVVPGGDRRRRTFL